MINGKKKGASFERHIGKVLSEAFDIQFRPTPGSGAYVGGQNRGSFDRLDVNEILAGDLIAGDSDFPFCIECKAYGDDPKFHQIMQGSCKVFDEWIVQAETDADHINKLPVIIFKINRKGTYAAFHSNPNLPDMSTIMSYMSYHNWYVMPLDDALVFLKHWKLSA